MTPTTQETLRQRREATIRAHMEAECKHDIPATLETFAEANYDVVPLGAPTHGASAVEELLNSLFDAFGFVADCLATDVETACDMKQRGGFERLRSKGADGPIRFEIYYREGPKERPITFELGIGLDASGRPYVEFETLKQRRKGQKHGLPFPFLKLTRGRGSVWAGEEALEIENEEDNTQLMLS